MVTEKVEFDPMHLNKEEYLQNKLKTIEVLKGKVEMLLNDYKIVA